MSSQTDEEAQFKEIMSQNELLMKENMLLREYLNRHTPGFGDVDAHNIEQAERAFMPSDEKHRESSDAKLEARHRSNRPVAGSVLKGKKDATQAVLTLNQKMNVLQEELSVRSKELVEIDSKAAKDVADLNAMMGETTIRVNELKKEAYEFRRDIVLGGEATRAKKVSAEKVIKYFEDKIRLKEQLIEKIKLKNQSLKNQIAKLDAQLRQKEEQGDSLHSIDFHQLKIENSLFNTRIAEKNAELLSLKTTTGKTVQVLNSVKRNLQNLLQEQARIKGEIAQHQDALIRLTEELSKVEEIVSKADKVNRKLKAVDSNSAALPQVMEYVGYAAQLHDLQSQRQNWIRKVEIAEMALRRKKTQQRKGQTVQ